MRTEDMYYNEQKRSEVMEAAWRLRRKKWIICWREFCRKSRNDILTKKRITGTLDSNMGEFPSC